MDNTNEKKEELKPDVTTTSGAESSSKDLPPMDFSMLLFSIAGSVQVHLGLIPNPATGKAEVNLPVAKQTIALIEILQTKTRGNLTDDEAKLIEHMLYELRIMYLEKQKGA